MPKTTKIAISITEDMLTDVERERKESGENRSEFFCRAVEALLRRRREQEMTERYIRAYRQNPETKEAIEASRQSATTILSENPW